MENVENALITRMVQTGSVVKHEHALQLDAFNATNKLVLEVLIKYEHDYHVCMDEPTLREQFPNFAWTPTDIQVEFFIDEIGNAAIENAVKLVIKDANETIGADPRAIAKKVAESIAEISAKYGVSTAKVQLMKSQVQRWEYFQSREKVAGLTGITTGLPLFDELFHGTQPCEIELWVARTGNCKTFALLHSAYRAYLQGKRVLFISPEMTADEIGIRLDALMYNISQSKMLAGQMSVQDMETFTDAVKVNNLMHSTDNHPGEFMFYDSFSLGRQFTTGDIRGYIDADKPDIVIVDGLLLILPVGDKFRDKRSEVAMVTSEFKAITMSTGVPLRIAHQANRKTEETKTNTKGKKVEAIDRIPESHHLAESGATEQFANRIITMKYDAEADMLYFALRKSRNSRADRIIVSRVDIDKGIIGIPTLCGATEEQVLPFDPEDQY